MTTLTSSQGAQLSGAPLLLAGLVLAVTNFIVVLDTTIANVSVPHISGGLGVSASQGTWIVTSYSVSEAICLPLTGWLSRRFGMVRVFMFSIIGFGLFSMLCGTAWSLSVLVAFRVGQGLCGGPIMALVQTLILRVFPERKRPQALAAWAMTTTTAPIAGPILGGLISDNWSWPWIFLINVPIAAACAFGVFKLMRVSENATETVRVDRVGLMLMVVWIAALQVMLDLGRDRDWFGSNLIVGLAIVASIGFILFIIWELTDGEPVVDLRVFRHRGFTAATISMSLGFGVFFASIVIIPQWLQTSLGYTATDAGYATAFLGILAVFTSPVVAALTTRMDPRILGCFGIAWFGLAALLRTHWTSGADFYWLALPQFVQGFGVAFFFIPITGIALGSVMPREVASAAGVMTFLRTLTGAFCTSIGSTMWDSEARVSRSDMVGVLHQSDQIVDQAARMVLSGEQARGMVERLVDQESVALATNHIFLLAAVIFFFAATLIWLAPRPRADVDTSAAH